MDDVDEKPWAHYHGHAFGGAVTFAQVVPVDDLVEHELSPSCWCNPAREDFVQPTFWGALLTTGMMWTHKALDGRN